MRLLCDDRRNEVQGIPALAGACGCTLLWIRAKLPVHAPCLNWSRFGRSRQKTNTASCVNSAMIEGMRYKVYLLLQWLVGAPSYGFGPSSPCMHRVWIGVDSGVPVRKLTRYHMVFCAKSSLTCSRAKFSSRVHLGLEASRMFRPTPHTKIWSNFVQSYFVRTLAYGTWLRSLINALVSGLGSMRAFWSGSLHGIM